MSLGSWNQQMFVNGGGKCINKGSVIGFLDVTGNKLNKESQYLNIESSNKTDTWYESKCLCSELGNPHLFPWTRPILGEPSLQVKD